VLEDTGTIPEGIENVGSQQDSTNRLIASAQALGDDQQIGHHAVLFTGVQPARASHATHHFIQDQEHAVAIADLAHALKVIRDRRHRPCRSADDSLCHEGNDRILSQSQDLILEGLCRACGIGLIAFVALLKVVGEARVDMMRLDQQRLKLTASAPSVLP